MKRSISLLLFLVVSVVVWWTITTDVSEHGQTIPEDEANYVEVFINDFKITSMGKNGKPAYTLSGERLENFSKKKNLSYIKSPVLNLMQENQWQITARRAIHNNKTNLARLIGDVVMQQLNTEPAITVHTQKIVFDLRKQVARTRSPVKIIQGQSELNSVGMVYNNKARIMSLSAQVNGFYQPANDSRERPQ